MHFQERLKAINDWRTIAPLKVKTFDASVAHRWSKGAPIDLHDCEDERSSCSVFLGIREVLCEAAASVTAPPYCHRPETFDSSSRGETVKAVVGKAALA
jgi:hypothetical protein